MGSSWWHRLKLVVFYKSEAGGWYLRIGRAGFHIVRCH